MLGANDYGSPYYGQGPTVGSTFTLHTVSAAAIALATISTKILINHAVSATVIAVASISRQFQTALSASAVTVASIASTVVEALNIRRGTTKFLSLVRSTNPVSGFFKSSKPLNVVKTTRNLRTGQ